jgi:hypothetical protein
LDLKGIKQGTGKGKGKGKGKGEWEGEEENVLSSIAMSPESESSIRV